MSILHAEQERLVLQERKNAAISACYEEERKLERIKDEISVQERMKKSYAQDIYELKISIATHEFTIKTLQQDIVSLQSVKSEKEIRAERDISVLEDNIAQLEAQRTGLTLDIAALQRAINELAREKGEKQQQIEDKSQELRIMIASVVEETEKRNEIIAKTVVEQTQITQDRVVLKKATDELQLEKEELYQLRTDLSIIRDRYAEFARKNTLPFNI